MYPKIDVVYYGNTAGLEYDFLITPGGDPKRIRFAFTGAERTSITANGDLRIETSAGELLHLRPVAYQEVNGKRSPVAAGYRQLEGGDYSLQLGPYDPKRTMVIDPVLHYLTYLGGPGTDRGLDVAADAEGNTYITGYTSGDFPVPTGQAGGTSGASDAFVSKISASGSELLYTAFLGGSGQENRPFVSVPPSPPGGIAVDASGNAYVVGHTTSTDFPLVNPLQNRHGGSEFDGFIAKLDPDGDLLYSTYLGGHQYDFVYDIAVDEQGAMYVTGDTTSTSFPRAQAIQDTHGGGTYDAFVAKLNPAGSQLVYSTFVGGSGLDFGRSIAVDADHNVYVVGTTDSGNLATANPLQGSLRGASDVFVLKLNAAGTSRLFSTYLGGSLADWSLGCAVDASGSLYLTGGASSSNFPTTPGALVRAGSGFITRLSQDGSQLLYSARGVGGDSIAVDLYGNAYVIGSGYQKLSADGTTLLYSMSLPPGTGIALDAASTIYLTGTTTSNSLATFNAVQPLLGGDEDAYVLRILQVPTAPTNLRATDVTQARVSLVWTATDQEDANLAVFRKPAVNGENTFGQVALLPANQMSYEDNLVSPYTTYRYFVRATNPYGASVSSNELEVVTPPYPPVANLDTYRVDEDTVLTVAAPGVLQNDSDPQNLTLTVFQVRPPDHGTLDLNADGSFIYHPFLNFSGTDSFSYRAKNPVLEGATTVVTLTVAPVNDPPTAGDLTVNTMEDTPGAVNLPASDVDGDLLTYEIVGQPAHGELTGNGAVRTYHPALDYFGPDSFTFRVSDGTAQSGLGTVAITVGPVNDPPTAGNLAANTMEDVPATISLPASDPDGDLLTYEIVGQPAHGELTGSGAVRTYRPAPDYFGPDNFTFRVSDGATQSGLGTIAITVGPVNDPPTVEDLAVNPMEDTPGAVNLPASDVDGDLLTYEIVGQPAHGELTGNGAVRTYHPALDFFGSDRFTFRVSDGATQSGLGTVAITVSPVNDPPSAVNNVYFATEDVPLIVPSPGVLQNDVDAEGSPLTAVLVTPPTHGTVTLDAAGSFTYTPQANFAGDDTFRYRATDGELLSGPATVTIVVQPVNDAPLATPDSFSTSHATTLTVTAPGILANDSDVENSSLQVKLVTPPQNGRLMLNGDGSFVYTPRVGFRGSDQFFYQIEDAEKVASASASVTLSVSELVPPPVGKAVSVNGTLSVTPGVSRISLSAKVDRQKVKGKLKFTDSGRRLTVSSTRLTTLVVSGADARLYGKARIGTSKREVDFVLYLRDNPEPTPDEVLLEVDTGPALDWTPLKKGRVVLRP